MKKILFWSPFLTQIATIKSVLNSASILKKENKELDVYIINCVGEWDRYKDKILSNNLKIISLINFNLHKYLPKKGYFYSRLSLIIISAVSILPLIFFLIKKKPDILISHLNTMITMFLSNFFRIKFIIRISGYHKLHFLRSFLWRILSKKIYAIICPTYLTKNLLSEKKIFKEEKIFMVEDPIFDINEIAIKENNQSKNIIAIGRLTKQKNFSFLIKSFNIIEKKYPNKYKLNILGEGEERNNLSQLVNDLSLNDKVNLLGYRPNIKEYFDNSFCFILSSLWEDPGFVLIESAINKTFILSSDCPNGPREFLDGNKGGLLFRSNDSEDLVNKFELMLKLDQEIKNKMLEYSVKKAKAYSFQEHYKKLDPIINKI